MAPRSRRSARFASVLVTSSADIEVGAAAELVGSERGIAFRSAAAPTSMSADDVTRTLANLADLRDRGAISAEEYEAKKADLLRRL